MRFCALLISNVQNGVTMRWVVLLVFVISAIYVHRRGKVKHRLMHQLSDHSTFLAPLNCFAYLFSAVPTTPFVDVRSFPELQLLRDEWETIRQEALTLRETSRIRASTKYNDIGFNSFFRNGWKRFYLKWYDRAHPSAERLCPRTTALLQQIPTIKAAMFAELPAGGKLMPHRDPFAGSLRYHLGLVTQNNSDCVIEVDGETYAWSDGEGVVFDETYIHSARNNSGVDRIILFCDIQRPMRYRWTQAILNFVGVFLLRSATSPNDENDRTGGLNRAFIYLYAVRLLGKRIKAWNRTLYYIIKWTLFGSIALLIFWR
jgi:beta-hydroxylase